MSKDYYKILGISKKASLEEIKRAYYKMAHKYHPDKGSGDEKMFKEVNEAYQVLSDKEKKAQYDKFGRIFEGGGAPPGFDFQWGWGQPNADFESGGFGDLGEMIEEMFGGGFNRKRKDFKKGKSIEITIGISLEDTLKGEEKIITLEKMASCPRCQGVGAEPNTKVKECFSCRGAGQVQQIKKTFLGAFTKNIICPECGGEGYKPEKPCNVCHGEGRIRGQEKLKIFIPAGVDTNQIIKIEGKGDAGRKGGKPGDLYVRILVRKHPVFKRKGDDLYLSMPISFSKATLGDEIEISTLGGKKIVLKIPPGTESGKIVRISKKGIPHFSSYGRGSLYVELVVETPKKLTKRQKELLEKLRKEGI